MSLASAFKVPEGKPAWILVRSSKEKNGADMDKVFADLKLKFTGKVFFMRYNWEDDKAGEVISQFSLDEPPASILTDKNGKVVEKFDGVAGSGEMIHKLNALLTHEAVCGK